VLQCTNHQPISVNDSVWSVNHVKPFISSHLQNLCFLNFALVRGCSPGSLNSLLWVRQCRPDIKRRTVVQPTYQQLNQRANGDAKFAADTCLEFQATIKLREWSEVKYTEVSTNCRRVVKFTSRLLYPRKRTPVATSQENEWAPELVWTFWSEKSVSLCRNLNSVRPAYSLHRLRYHVVFVPKISTSSTWRPYRVCIVFSWFIHLSKYGWYPSSVFVSRSITEALPRNRGRREKVYAVPTLSFTPMRPIPVMMSPLVARTTSKYGRFVSNLSNSPPSQPTTGCRWKA